MVFQDRAKLRYPTWTFPVWSTLRDGTCWLTSSPSLSDVPSATSASSANSFLPKACPTPRRKAVKSFRPHRTRRSLINVVSRRVCSVTLRRWRLRRNPPLLQSVISVFHFLPFWFFCFLIFLPFDFLPFELLCLLTFCLLIFCLT